MRYVMAVRVLLTSLKKLNEIWTAKKECFNECLKILPTWNKDLSFQGGARWYVWLLALDCRGRRLVVSLEKLDDIWLYSR